jgi:glycosyltransferase involved in cell wall biosynthesis
MRSLYLCYFSLHEPLVQTQVLPYLRQLRDRGVEVWLLTFETGGGHAPDELEPGIHWHSLPYHRRPTLPATLYDVLVGAIVAARLVRRHGIELLHARSHVAAAMGALAKKAVDSCQLTVVSKARPDVVRGGTPSQLSTVNCQLSTVPKLLFDIRGFLAEEYVDAGVWPAGGWLYRLTKRVERWLFDVSDGFVVLTERARDALFPGRSDTDARGRPVAVIPCCVDRARFEAADAICREAARAALGVEGRRVIVYTGALGGWYLTEELADFLAVAHREDPATFSLILTQSSPDTIAGLLRSRGISPGDVRIERVAPSEVPIRLKAADLAVSLIKPGSSKLSSSPTKIAEYLAAGLPVISNTGIGDVDAVLTERVGVLISEFTHDAYRRALAAADELRRDPGIAERCRAVAHTRFCTERVGGERYWRLYRQLAPCAPSADESRSASAASIEREHSEHRARATASPERAAGAPSASGASHD